MPREQGDSGEFVETIAPEDALDVFDTVDGPVILSADVADHFDVTRETARRKLQQLYDQGDLDRRKVSRRVIYWRPDAGDGFDAEDLQGDPETTLDDGDAPTEDDVDPTDAALAGWSYGRGDEEQAANHTVARASLEWLRETGDAVRQGDVPLDDMAEIDPEDRKEDTLWRTVIRGAWQHADGQGYVDRPDSRTYQWAGPDAVDDGEGEIYDPTEEF